METEPKKYKNYIVPYVRRGFSASDSWGANAEKASVGIKVDFKMSKVEDGECEKSTTESFTKHIPLAGPELVKQLRSSAIYQVNPADGTAGKSNDYMPYIEFYEEDLPWRFTPRGKGEQIPPWMMLLALKDDEFSVSVNEQGTKVLTVNSAEEGIYPDADKFYCYAHLQLSVPEDYNGSLTDYIKEYPEQCISRLICHRSLEPDTHYTLFLVPSFEIGRVAGLGDTNYDYANLDFSWTNQTDYKNQFPVYYQTSMLSGKATFLDMAKRLSGISQEQYEDLPTSLKVNIDDVYQYTDKPTEGKTIQVPMALGKKNDSELTQQEQIVTEVVKNLLEKNSVFYENLNNQYNEESDPWIVPPVYGARHSLAVLDKGEGKWSSSQFVDDVNLHLHNRVAAGLGSQVVKTHQEELVHRAWTQVEQVNAVNQLIREMIQMRKINESSSKKIQDRKGGEVDEKYAGMYTDAAKKITLGGRIYNFEPRTLLNEIIAEDSHKEQEDGNPVPYEISQGITTEMLKYMSQPSVWKESSKKWISNTLTYRLLTSPNNKSLFILNYPHFEFLNEYSWGLLSRTDEAKSQLQIYKVDGDSKSGDLTKFWIRPLVWDDTLLFPYLYDYINTEEDIPLSNFTSWIKHILEYYKNKYYSKNYDHGMFLPFMYKSSNSKDFGFFMPDFKYKHLLETLNLNKDCKYITLDAEEKVKEKEKNGNTKNQYVPRTVYIFPEKTVREKTVDMYSDTPWDKGKTCHWRLNEKNESIKLCVDFNNPRKGEFGLRFSAKPEKVKIDRHVMRDGKFKRSGSMTLDNSKPVSTACHIDKLRNLESTLSAKDKNSRLIIKSRESQCGLENVIPKDLDNLYFYLKIQGTRFSLHRSFEGKVNTKNQIEIPNEKLKYFSSELEKGSIPRTYSAVIDKECRENICKTLNEAIEVLEEADNYFWYPRTIKFEVDKKEQHADLSFYKITKMDDRVKEVKSMADEIGKYIEKLLEEKLPIEEFKPEEKSITFPTNDASARNMEAVKEFVAEYYKNAKIDFSTYLNSRYPVMAYPVFPEPTSFYLTELSQKYILPAIENMPMNSICCFHNKPEFEEAFLAGMNTEMGRELLWREYPTDERGSYFRKFWSQDQLPDAFDDNFYDVKVMQSWHNKLGKNHTPLAQQGMTVFVMKGDLMLVYPDFTAYITTQKGTEIKSDMTGWLNNETFMVGFRALEEKINLNTDFLTIKELDQSLRFSNSKPIDDKATINSVQYAIHKKIASTIVHIPLVNIYNE